MRRSRVPYLQVREGTYHFRFQIPSPYRAVIGRSEIRQTLNTSDSVAARERVARILPLVYSLKRLCRRCMELTAEQARRAISFAVNRLIEALQDFETPWLDQQSQDLELTEIALFGQALKYQPDVRQTKVIESWLSRTDSVSNELRNSAVNTVMANGGAALTHTVLSALGIVADEQSQLFRDLSVELAKLHLAIRRTLSATSQGDHSAQTRLVDYYRRMGYLTNNHATVVTPPVSDAWESYAQEKLEAKPNPAWNAKNAASQDATFREFREIVGDVQVAQISRDAVLNYRNTIARLPANRQKRHPGKSIQELLTLDIPTDHLPSARTVSEKLVRIGAFLKWCRETKGYLIVDPLAGVQVESSSQSYAIFTQDDLQTMFGSSEYIQSGHNRSWQFWIPLIALYSGARQTEIAQLLVRDIVKEDGVEIFVITDLGDDQTVKTSAGVRKVPISSKLVRLGFLEYVAALRKRGETRLFPDLKKGRDGWGQKVSRWFADVFKKSVGIKPDPTGRRKVFHSFRHTAITKALSKSVSLPHAQQVFGHEKSLLGETATYVAPFPVATLVPVIEALEFDLDHSQYEGSWREYLKRLPDSEGDASSRSQAA